MDIILKVDMDKLGSKNDIVTVKTGFARNFLIPHGKAIIATESARKIVAEVTVDGQGWNGKYNGKILSSNDYWFSAHLIPVNPNKPSILKKGHFSLLRK